ncbi:hypothetical protein [Falsihalocynthiibacter sp. CO-5D18]|uniref:hypothetical protein n=1 Tax=Falsihalocynthiibacter sp. CO-5D18 TaxID=3240872 RepID=UPI00350F65D9
MYSAMHWLLPAQSGHPAHVTSAADAARISAVREICGKSHSHGADLAADAPKVIYEFSVWLGVTPYPTRPTRELITEPFEVEFISGRLDFVHSFRTWISRVPKRVESTVHDGGSLGS